MRRTKIVCTMGPNTDKKPIMEALVKNGMNVARFNFSHGDYEEQRNRFIADAENNGSKSNISAALEHMQQVQDIASGKLVPITPYATSQNLNVPFYSQENKHYCGLVVAGPQ